MKNAIVIATSLLLSTTAFAATHNQTGFTHIDKEGYQTREQAYSAGFDVVDTLNQMTSREQAFKLGLMQVDLVNNSVGVDEMEVVVEEYAPQRGQIAYRARVNIDYHYTERSND